MYFSQITVSREPLPLQDPVLSRLPSFEDSIRQVQAWLADNPLPRRQSGREHRVKCQSRCALAYFALQRSHEGRAFLHQVMPRTKETSLKWSADRIRALVLADPTLTRTTLHQRYLGAYKAIQDRYPGLLDELFPTTIRQPKPQRPGRAQVREAARLKERARLAKLARDARPAWG
jgi:hypothetical protein